MSGELLSICIPTYNRASFLKELLETFSRQIQESNLTSNDVEFYISDNASVDTTPEVVKAFERHGFSTTYSRNPANIGVSRNLLRVCAMARGSYWWTLGDDERICEKALVNILHTLRREKPGLLLAFDSDYPFPPLPVPQVFLDYPAFARACLQLNNPYPIADQTLLSCNIFRGDCYDPVSAEQNVGTFLPHMYGMMRLLIQKRAPVVLPDFPIITVRKSDRGGPRDGVWPDIDACWIQYLKWLRDEMRMPELDPAGPTRIARRRMFQTILSNPFGYFHKNWRVFFQPSAYRCFFSRLFR